MPYDKVQSGASSSVLLGSWIVRCFCALAFAIGCSSGSESSVTSSSSLRAASANGVLLSFADVTVQSKGDTAHFEGAQLATTPGRPALPVRRVRVLMDPDADLHQITAEFEDVEEKDLPGAFQVEPVAAPVRNGVPLWPAEAKIDQGKDMVVYGKDELYPASNVAATTAGQLHRFKIVDVLVYPYRWNPVTGALRELVRGQLVVHAATTAKPVVASAAFDAVDKRHIAKLANLVANFDTGIQKYVAASSAPAVDVQQQALTAGAKGYAIITTNNIASTTLYLDAFADAKIAQGFAVELITETRAHTRQTGSWVCIDATSCGGGWGGGVGDAAAENLRGWLSSNYANHQLAYAVLIGNPDPSQGDVPMKMVPASGASSNAPTDFYYAELTGKWEVIGDTDLFAEISVGRIPVYGDETPLNHILAKTIAYGKQAPADIAWRKNALVAIKGLDTYPTPTYELGEWIRSAFLVPNGWSVTRIYDQDYGVSPEITPCTYNTVLGAWRSTPRGLAVWESHGESDGSDEIISAERAAELDDLHPSITFASSCLTAYPEASDNLTYSLLKNGAVAAVGATRDEGYSAALTGPSGGDAMASSFVKYLVTANQTVGDALDSARTELTQDWNDVLVFNLHGDPSLSIGMSGSGNIEVPLAPISLSAAASDGNVDLSWSMVPAASSYVVRRATTAGGPYTIVGTTSMTSYTDRTVSDGTAYYYVVSGRSLGGDGPASAEALATPSHALEVQYQVGDRNPSDNVIEPFVRVINSSGSGLPLSGVTVRYWFSDDSDYGSDTMVYTCDWATVSCANVKAQVVRRSPMVQSSYAGANAYIEIGFADGLLPLAVGQSSEVRGYISRGSSLNFNESDDYSYDATRTSYADFRRVTGYVNGVRSWGDEPAYVAFLPSPKFMNANAANGHVTLSWNAVNGAVAYDVYRSSSVDPQRKIATTAAANLNDTTVSNEVTYTYSVYAVNANGLEGFPSGSVTATPSAAFPTQAPSAPTELTATVQNGVATISWQVVQNALSYNLKRATVSGGPYLVVASDIQQYVPTTAVTGFTGSTTYYFVVSAIGVAGEGLPSEELAVNANGMLPAKVIGVSATSGPGQTSLSWTAAARATGYVIKRAIAGGRTYQYQTVGTTTGTSFVDSTGLVAGLVYAYVVVGTDAAGEGTASEMVTSMPSPSEPCSPTQTVSAGQSGSLIITLNTTGADCLRTTDDISGWGCANCAGRTLKINRQQVTFGQTPLPAKINGYYYFDVSAGTYSWASLYWWK